MAEQQARKYTARRRGRQTTKNCNTSPARIRRTEKIKEALDYRKCGYTYAQIARQMKCSQSVAHTYVVDGLTAMLLVGQGQGAGRCELLIALF